MRSTTRIRCAVVALALATVGAAVFAAASPASAATGSAQATESAEAPAVLLHGDACGPAWGSWAVPDSGYAPFYFNFHDACHSHDNCYGAAPYGRNEWGRLQCDNIFLADMYRWCANRYAWYNPGRPNCNGVANTYYAAVRAGGAFSFY